MRAWIGCDPGKKGCIALLVEDGTVKFNDWPGPKDSFFDFYATLCKWVIHYEVKRVTIEKVSARPKDGRVSAFSFGYTAGMLRGMILGLTLPVCMVPPATWHKKMTFPKDGATPKARALRAAERLFPGAEILGPRGGVRDGRVDAILLAEYGRREAA